MKCPVCKEVDLMMSERQGVEIDYCPQCRGGWLDRGELDKIIERSEPAGRSRDHRDEAYRDRPASYGHGEQPRYTDKHHDRHHSDNRHSGHPKRRESFFGELFDFD